MPTRTETLLAYARLAPVIPVVTIEDARRSIDLAQTLVEAGLPVVEVTLRTPAALDAIAAIAKAVPEAVVAAGTVVRPEPDRRGGRMPAPSSSSRPARRAGSRRRWPRRRSRSCRAAPPLSEAMALASSASRR